MPTLSRRRLAPHLLLGLALPLLAGAGEDENWPRLLAMPREQRAVLAEKLREFDRLSRDQQAAVRTLDAKIAALPAAQRANNLAVLRRYHLWLQTLSEEERSQVTAAQSHKEKLALIAKFREVQGEENDRGPTYLLFQVADLRGRTPFEVARMLQLWFTLNPGERDEIEKHPVRDRMKRLSELSRQAQLPPLVQLTKQEEEATSKQLDKHLQTKGWLRSQLKKDSEKQAIDRRRLLINYYFVANPPKPVSATNLLRFETAMPSWIRTTFDHLTPEEARRRLTILYRLIYPPGKEIGPAGPGAKEPPKAAKPPVAPPAAAPSPPI